MGGYGMPLFVVIDKTHKLNTVVLAYGRGNGFFLQNKLELFNNNSCVQALISIWLSSSFGTAAW